MILICYTTSVNFNWYMLLCGDNSMKQKTVHSCMIICVIHVGLVCKASKDF
jgi:hypothetical protein